MKKKTAVLLALIMVLTTVVFTGCGNKTTSEIEYSEEFQAFLNVLDTDYSKEVQQFISEQGDDDALGFRGAGGEAETTVAEYVKEQMTNMGLSNVTMDPITVDGWNFKGANFTFTNVDGEKQQVTLGGYQCTCKADNEKVKVVYLNKGTSEDYEGIDVKDKLVLIDIDQNEEWWISSPAVQAMLHGAKGVLANSAMYTESGDRIGTQDICAPAEAVAFGISDNDTQAVKEAINASGNNEIEVVFNADSEVMEDTESHCVWGEIPGQSDEVIYMMAHMDGYFHSFFDDASGVGLIMGVAKGIIDSGYEPAKTIRFVINGAEEYGKANSEADWAIGAYELINNVHPEWIENAFAVVNIDGAYCTANEKSFSVAVPEELAAFAKEIADPMIAETDYEYKYLTPQSTYKEDFNYTALGIPSVGTGKGDEHLFYDSAYHTSDDTEAANGFNEDTWLWMHTLYARYVYEFDATPARPLDFGARFEALKESYDIVDDDDLIAIIDDAIEAAAPVTEKINQLNADYDAAVADGDTDTAEALLAEAKELNKQTHKAYRAIQDALLWLDGDLGIVFPHDVREDNITNLKGAIDALKDGDAVTASEEYLQNIGNAWYAMFFDEDTISYREGHYEEGLKDTWAEGRTDLDFCDVYGVNNLLQTKNGADEDYSAEISKLESEKADQESKLADVIKKEKSDFKDIIKMLKNIA